MKDSNSSLDYGEQLVMRYRASGMTRKDFAAGELNARRGARRQLCARAHKRKNGIHLGSENAGPKVEALLSVAATCRRLEHSLRDYLLTILPGMADRKHHDAKTSPPPAGNSVQPDRIRQDSGWTYVYGRLRSGT
ncbi:MAG: hypothetical protein IT170_12725 [Bryobacterales bacterium]|nr:hypothetical protein [Bryobacterales bacterium]